MALQAECHVEPLCAAVGGLGDSEISKAEGLIVRDQMLFAGQDDTLSFGVFCQRDEVVQQRYSDAAATELGDNGQSENGEVAAMWVVVGGVMEKLVADCVAVGGATVHMPNDSSGLLSNQETIGESSDPGCE